MNTQQAKRIPLQDILSRLGHQPAKQVRGELWYCSPFRPETVPSFKINTERNVWYDFGEGDGGNVLDFVMKFHKVGTVSEALSHLGAFDQPVFPSFAPVAATSSLPVAPKPVERPEVVVKPLQHKALINYLAGRGIPSELAARYIDEIHYTRDGKDYFALGFRNASDGYELRNPYFKGTHGPKDITILQGLGSPSETLSVFEGFLDFLSAQVAGVLSQPLPTVIVMNSTALKDRTVAAIRESGASRVDLYLDHDKTGRDITSYLRQELTGLDIADCAGLYVGHKDFNEYLTAGRPRAVSR
jgi:hypothetical protein